MIFLPHLADLKGCALVLRLRAVAELQNGQSEKALTDVQLMLRLAGSIRTEPILISHLVRIAVANLALQPVYDGLAEHKWSDAQLAELDRELAGLDFPPTTNWPCVVKWCCARKALSTICDVTRNNCQICPAVAIRASQTSPQAQPSNPQRLVLPKPARWLPVYGSTVFAIGRFWSSGSLLRRLFVVPMRRWIWNSSMSVLTTSLRPCSFRRSAARCEDLPARRHRRTWREPPSRWNVTGSPTANIPKRSTRWPRSSSPNCRTTSLTANRCIIGAPTMGNSFYIPLAGMKPDDGGEVGLKKDGAVDINKGDWVWRYPAK